MLLDGALEPGTPLADVLPLVEDVLEVETTPNRPDLLSIYGLAREVAALFDAELAPWPGVEPARDGDEPVDVRIEDEDGCPRYVGRLFRDVAVGPSPVWMKARIAAAGMRPISNVVDVTNYVMLGLGNPLHAFDHDTLAGGRIVVRRAAAGEEIRTLDGQQRKLDPRDLLIADGERAIAIAGIMGGEETEVSERTTNVLLEAANFEPVVDPALVGAARAAHGGVEPLGEGRRPASRRVMPPGSRSQLLVETTGGRWVGETDAQAALPERARIELRPARTSALLGLDVPAASSTRFSSGSASSVDGDVVSVPTWRARDVTREADLVEEVARFVLDEVPFTLPPRRELPRPAHAASSSCAAGSRTCSLGCGLSEAYTPSLARRRPAPGRAAPADAALDRDVGPAHDAPAEPARGGAAQPRRRQRGRRAVRDRACLSPVGAAAPGRAVARRRRARGRLRRCEGRRRHAARGAARGAGLRARRASAAPSRQDRAAAAGLGRRGASRRSGHGWSAFELDLAGLGGAPGRVLYEDGQPVPEVRQDLAFVVDEDVPAASLAAAMREAAGPELRDVRVFDEYRGGQIGEGKRSLAFRVAFGSPERTLTDEDAAALRGTIVEALAQQFGAVLRA